MVAGACALGHDGVRDLDPAALPRLVPVLAVPPQEDLETEGSSQVRSHKSE